MSLAALMHNLIKQSRIVLAPHLPLSSLSFRIKIRHLSIFSLLHILLIPVYFRLIFTSILTLPLFFLHPIFFMLHQLLILLFLKLNLVLEQHQITFHQWIIIHLRQFQWLTQYAFQHLAISLDFQLSVLYLGQIYPKLTHLIKQQGVY